MCLARPCPVAQPFLSAGSRCFPAPCPSNWGLESPQNPQTRMSALPPLNTYSGCRTAAASETPAAPIAAETRETPAPLDAARAVDFANCDVASRLLVLTRCPASAIEHRRV